MKMKFNTKGFMKNLVYGFMTGAATTFNALTTTVLAYSIYYAHKSGNKTSRNWLAWLTAVSAFSTYLSIKNEIDYIDGTVCDYEPFIYEPTEENEEIIQDDTYTV